MPEPGTREDARHYDAHAADGGAADMERARRDRERVSILSDPPPYSAENETALVGAVLLDNNQLDNEDVAAVVDGDFVNDTERTVMRWAKEMHAAGQPVDAITLMPRIQNSPKRGDGTPVVASVDVARMIRVCGVALHAPFYAQNVKEAGDRRRNWVIGVKLVQDSHNGKIPRVAASEAVEQLEAWAPKTNLPVMGVGNMIETFTELRAPVIEGILRAGETLNVIAAPKVGKSWLTNDLAISIATGRPWLGFDTVQGNVLIVDNELHPETSAHRIPAVANARMIREAEYGNHISVCNLRGKLMDINRLGAELFDRIKPGEYKIIIIDALYRVLPAGVNENDPSMATVYNAVDHHALRIGCGFVLIHHSSKGNQAGKAVTDVGSGSGVQSRATDAHLVLRQHEQPGAVVVDAAVRSWQPLEPFCLRWTFPVFDRADDLDPALLKREGKRANAKPKETADAPPPPPAWTWERFGPEIVGTAYKTKAEIMADALAVHPGFSKRGIEDLLEMAVAKKGVYRFCAPGGKPLFSTSTKAPEVNGGEGGAHTPRTPRAKSRTATARGRGKRRTRPLAKQAKESLDKTT